MAEMAFKATNQTKLERKWYPTSVAGSIDVLIFCVSELLFSSIFVFAAYFSGKT